MSGFASGQETSTLDAAAVIQLMLTLAGGLGIFLLGMKNMSEGMQAVAGSSLRRIISAVTNNRFMATGVGVVVTCIVQSSSVTTVMVVGFVNSAVMELSQAMGVIMGANIGTTITGWILVVKIGKYGLPILGVAAFVYLFSRGDRWRYWAMCAMGIGMVFFGLELMKEACSTIKESSDFEQWFHFFEANNLLGILGCVLIGCLLTLAVQSSSATLGVTISLAYQGVISYPTAAALVLGENIGTTITAYLASLGTTTNARRAAYFHVIFNLVGVLWVTAIFSWFIAAIQWMLQVDVAQVVIEDGNEVYPNTTAAIAATHTAFNVVNTMVFLPFVSFFARFLTKIVPSKDYRELPHLTGLDIRMLETPLLAIEQSQKEITVMGRECCRMMRAFALLVRDDKWNTELAVQLIDSRRALDSMQNEIAEFITNLLSGTVPHSVAEQARRQLQVADEYKSITEYIGKLAQLDGKLRQDDLRFTAAQLDDILALHAEVAAYLASVGEGLNKHDPTTIGVLERLSESIGDKIRELRRAYLANLPNGQITPRVSLSYLTALNAYSRIRDHSREIVLTMSRE